MLYACLEHAVRGLWPLSLPPLLRAGGFLEQALLARGAGRRRPRHLEIPVSLVVVTLAPLRRAAPAPERARRGAAADEARQPRAFLARRIRATAVELLVARHELGPV